MPRIPLLPEKDAGLFTRLCYRFSRRRYGVVVEPAAVMGYHPKLLFAVGLAELAMERALTVLPVSLRELAVYRVATRVGCSWCVDFGTLSQRNKGLDIDRLAEIDDYLISPRFTKVERLALAYADAMTAQPMEVTDEQVAQLDERLGHAGLVELTYAIALENERARFNHALGLTDQGFTSGAACAVPPSKRSGMGQD